MKNPENTEGAMKYEKSRETGNIYRTQDAVNQNKNTTQYVLDTTIHKQTQINKICTLLQITRGRYKNFVDN